MIHCSRKYVIRLLNGSHHYRKHRGRKSSYSPEARKFLVQIWRAESYICPIYLRSMIENAIQDYKELGYTVPPEVADELKRMSASTMNRILRPYRIQFNAPPTNAPAARPRSRLKSPPAPAPSKWTPVMCHPLVHFHCFGAQETMTYHDGWMVRSEDRMNCAKIRPYHGGILCRKCPFSRI